MGLALSLQSRCPGKGAQAESRGRCDPFKLLCWKALLGGGWALQSPGPCCIWQLRCQVILAGRSESKGQEALKELLRRVPDAKASETGASHDKGILCRTSVQGVILKSEDAWLRVRPTS